MGENKTGVLLAIDTTGKTCAVAIASRDLACEVKTIANLQIRGNKAHGESLAPAVDALFALAGVAPAELCAVACSSGPGSFTGIRIGAAVAKGLAAGLNIPLVPVNTLAALAIEARGRGVEAENERGIIYAPIIDARRGQVYSAFYMFAAESVLPVIIEEPGCRMFDGVLKEAEALAVKRGAAGVTFTGDGVYGREDLIRGAGMNYARGEAACQNAASVAEAAFALIAGEPDVSSVFSVEKFTPFYARLAQAEQDLKDRLNDGT